MIRCCLSINIYFRRAYALICACVYCNQYAAGRIRDGRERVWPAVSCAELGAKYRGDSLSCGVGERLGEVNIRDITAGVEHDSKLGEPGLGMEVQALYFVHPRVAVGVEASQEWFAEELSSGWWVDGKTSQRRYLLATRWYVNPQSKTKVYAALGGGLAHTKISLDFSPEEEFSYTGFGYYAGLGIERSLNAHWSVELEMRYNGNKFHDEKQIANGDYMEVSHQANYLSGILQMNYRI